MSWIDEFKTKDLHSDMQVIRDLIVKIDELDKRMTAIEEHFKWKNTSRVEQKYVDHGTDAIASMR